MGTLGKSEMEKEEEKEMKVNNDDEKCRKPKYFSL